MNKFAIVLIILLLGGAIFDTWYKIKNPPPATQRVIRRTVVTTSSPSPAIVPKNTLMFGHDGIDNYGDEKASHIHYEPKHEWNGGYGPYLIIDK